MISSASFSLHRPHLTSSHSQPSSSSSSSILQQATTSLSFTSSIPPAPLLLFPLYTLLIKSLQFVFLSLLCASPLLIPLKDVNRSNVRENTMVILMIWLLTHQMWYVSSPSPSPLSPLTSHLSPLTSHLSPLTSHLSPFTSHLSPLTSHLSPLTSLLPCPFFIFFSYISQSSTSLYLYVACCVLRAACCVLRAAS